MVCLYDNYCVECNINDAAITHMTAQTSTLEQILHSGSNNPYGWEDGDAFPWGGGLPNHIVISKTTAIPPHWV